MLPPTTTQRILRRKSNEGLVIGGTARQQKRVPRKRELCVFTGGVALGEVGSTACVVIQDNRVARRNLSIRGQVIWEALSRYLEEAATLRSPRALCDSLNQRGMTQDKFEPPVVHA